MKNYMKMKNILLTLVALSIFSCEHFLGGDLNVDPNKPSTVPITGLLPHVQISVADTYGGSFSRWNALFTQQVEGVDRQWASYNEYQIQPVEFDGVWGNYYENILIEIKAIKELSIEKEYNHHLAVAQILEAFTILTAVDVWGDIPYTQAALGPENLNPVFDDDQSVYEAAYGLLTGSITLLDGSAGSLAVGNEDLYYQGNTDQWKKATNALLARYHLHLGEYSDALIRANASFTSRSDNLSYQYGAAPDGGAWYRFNDNRNGDIEFHPTMEGIMEGLNDIDRLGMININFTVGHPYLIDEYHQDLISYREIQFIIAESLLRSSGSATDLRQAYLNGIEASFQEFGFAPESTEYDAYVAQGEVDPGEGNITEEMILTQKYIAQFVQPEVFNDWRRTGIPALTPTSGIAIPRRWNYGSNSILFNSNAPAESDFDLFSPRVFWDK